jgi:predicted phosphate transport protein (TIGR00153 family)
VIRLFPREESYLPQFAKAADILLQATRELDGLAADLTDVELKVQKIKHLEHEGDQVAHQIFSYIGRTWITPIEREDIHTLASRLDDVLDDVDAVASRLVLFRIDRSTPELKDATALIVQSVQAIQRAVSLLGDMKNGKEIIEACIEVKRLESEADALNRIAIGKLFDDEKDPITLLKWKEIYELLEMATDRCEDVANVLEQIVLKAS